VPLLARLVVRLLDAGVGDEDSRESFFVT
jgi:hypothetical protein